MDTTAFRLPPHPVLAGHSRVGVLPGTGRAWVAAETLVLASAGLAAAALTMFVDLHLRIPGHAILFPVFPTTLGLALVPRRGSGSAVAAFAGAGVFALGGTPGSVGAGAFTSLVATGPLLDLAVRRARGGPGVLAGLVLGGLAANLLAFGVRLGAKLLLPEGGRPMAGWLPAAAISYPVCGAAAGLVSALLWFRLRERTPGASA